jgi:plasmid replication initiation protein
MGEVVQLELFTVTTVDPPWRDNRDAMEFPFLSLQKKRTKPIEYRNNNVHLSVGADSRFSIATIWDWDIIIFAASHLNECVEAGRRPAPRIRFVPHDCLRQIARHCGGQNYRELAHAIRRLSATLVITNIREHDQSEEGAEAGFHWLTHFRIPKRYTRSHLTPLAPDGEPDPVRPWEIELPAWLYNAILRQRDILAVHPDYFRLTGGMERWLYRLARKAVPERSTPPAIAFRMETLHRQSGTTRELKKFAYDIRQIAETQSLPEYSLRIDRDGRHELVSLFRDPAKPGRFPRGFRLSVIKPRP